MTRRADSHLLDHPTLEEIQRADPNRQIKRYTSHKYAEDIHLVAYTDGSTVYPTSAPLARSGWAAFFAEEHNEKVIDGLLNAGVEPQSNGTPSRRFVDTLTLANFLSSAKTLGMPLSGVHG